MNADRRHAAGAAAETAAAEYLQHRGVRLLARNYRCRQGEIDLIIQDGGVIAFVEVRQRARLAAAADSIVKAKRAKIQRAAEHYLMACDGIPPCRFDAVIINADGCLRWIKNAFDAEE